MAPSPGLSLMAGHGDSPLYGPFSPIAFRGLCVIAEDRSSIFGYGRLPVMRLGFPFGVNPLPDLRYTPRPFLEYPC